jgi:tripartite-type tricarboxylate transporter receptor subunit TctC
MEFLLPGTVKSGVPVNRAIRRIAMALVAAALPAAAAAQVAGYPSKPIRVIAPFPAGGPV